MVVDHDGKGLYSTGIGHGDAQHVGQFHPKRPGIDVFQVHEDENATYGISYRQGDSADITWGVYSGRDTGRGMAADIDPRYECVEVWASGLGLYTNDGRKISDEATLSVNFCICWDVVLQR